jgi:hypothetical protein
VQPNPQGWSLDPEGFDRVSDAIQEDLETLYEPTKKLPTELGLFVPREEADRSKGEIARGSAVVAFPDPADENLAWVYWTEPGTDFTWTLADRALIATAGLYEDLLKERKAETVLPTDDLREVARFEVAETELTVLPGAEAALAAWVGSKDHSVPARELRRSAEAAARMEEEMRMDLN